MELNCVLHIRATSWDFILFHARSLSEGSNKSAHLAVSLEPLPTGQMRLCVPVTAFVQKCRPRGSHVNTKGTDTLVGRLRKAWMHPAFIYLSIFFILFYFFVLLHCLRCAKMLRIEGQLAATKPHLFGQFIFHQEPVLDQTMNNLCTTEYNWPKIPWF